MASPLATRMLAAFVALNSDVSASDGTTNITYTCGRRCSLGNVVSAFYSAAEPNRKARGAAILFIVAIFGTIAIIIALLVFI